MCSSRYAQCHRVAADAYELSGVTAYELDSVANRLPLLLTRLSCLSVISPLRA